MATTSAPQARLLPSLSLVVSMSVTYRRLLVVCCLPPIVVITAPICLGLLLGVLNFITQGYGVLFAVMASLFTLCARRLVFQYAPSKKRGEEALRQSRIWLPLASVAVSLLVIRFLVFPIATILGIQGYNTLTSHFHFPAILRLAAGVLLLGLAVVARYVGPASVGTFHQNLKSLPRCFPPSRTALYDHSPEPGSSCCCSTMFLGAPSFPPDGMFDAVCLGALYVS